LKVFFEVLKCWYYIKVFILKQNLVLGVIESVGGSFMDFLRIEASLKEVVTLFSLLFLLKADLILLFFDLTFLFGLSKTTLSLGRNKQHKITVALKLKQRAMVVS
jgi:hypothetical protein